MAMVIFASALGVIIITEGLFLRRLLGDIAELRRQITGIDRQMRAQRAHVTALRHLLTEPDDELPREAVAVSGGSSHLPPPRPEPVRRKKHLGLHLGGALALAAAAGAAVREALTMHRGHLAGAMTGVAVTGTAVTALTITPWVSTAEHIGPQPSAPAAPPGQLQRWLPEPHPPHSGTTPATVPTASLPPPAGSAAPGVGSSSPAAEGVGASTPAEEAPVGPDATPDPGGSVAGDPGLVEASAPPESPSPEQPSESPPPTPEGEPPPCLTVAAPPDEGTCLLSSG